MRQPSLFPDTPIARNSDPITSHKAASKTERGRMARQQLCLEVLRDAGQPMTSSEIAEACCSRFCPDLRSRPVEFSRELSNYRKRADEIKRNPNLCVILDEERNGAKLFRVKGQT